MTRKKREAVVRAAMRRFEELEKRLTLPFMLRTQPTKKSLALVRACARLAAAKGEGK